MVLASAKVELDLRGGAVVSLRLFLDWITTNTRPEGVSVLLVEGPVARAVCPGPRPSSFPKGEHICEPFHVTTRLSRDLAYWQAPSSLELACLEETGHHQGVARLPSWQAPIFKELDSSG